MLWSVCKPEGGEEAGGRGSSCVCACMPRLFAKINTLYVTV